MATPANSGQLDLSALHLLKVDGNFSVSKRHPVTQSLICQLNPMQDSVLALAKYLY